MTTYHGKRGWVRAVPSANHRIADAFERIVAGVESKRPKQCVSCGADLKNPDKCDYCGRRV